jgi:hypothetical protein
MSHAAHENHHFDAEGSGEATGIIYDFIFARNFSRRYGVTLM